MYIMSSQKPYLKIFTSEEKSWKKESGKCFNNSLLIVVFHHDLLITVHLSGLHAWEMKTFWVVQWSQFYCYNLVPQSKKKLLCAI